MPLVFLGLVISIRISASENNSVYEENTAIYYNQGGVIPDEKSWDNYLAEQKRIRANKKKGLGSYCNCVLYAQSQGLGLSGYGLAKNYPINSLTPGLSGWVVTYESRPGPIVTGHIAKYILDNEELVLDEDNYKSCQVTKGRRLSIHSPLIKGYIN